MRTKEMGWQPWQLVVAGSWCDMGEFGGEKGEQSKDAKPGMHLIHSTNRMSKGMEDL